jgi:immune inhibitor A
MAPRHCAEPCFIPPHPDLVARTRSETSSLRGRPDEVVLKEKARANILGERKIPGMNDGTIFPRSHFEKPTSVMAMSSAALERTPLTGPIR